MANSLLGRMINKVSSCNDFWIDRVPAPFGRLRLTQEEFTRNQSITQSNSRQVLLAWVVVQFANPRTPDLYPQHLF